MRHRWHKLRLHGYICKQCGCGKVNAAVGGGWVTTFHKSDGHSTRGPTPPCEPGIKTEAYLGHYAAELQQPQWEGTTT